MAHTPRLQLPSPFSNSSASPTASSQRVDTAVGTGAINLHSATDLVVAEAHLRRLKERVRKSISKLTIAVWQRIPLSTHAMRRRSADIAQWGSTWEKDYPPFQFVKVLRRASDAVRLKWCVTAADILSVFQFWKNSSALAFPGNELAAACVAECRPTPAPSVTNTAGEIRIALQDQLTLIVWRLQNILVEHTSTNKSYQTCPAAIRTRKFDDNGIAVYDCMILTASDILPVTSIEARVLFHKPNLVRAIHLALPDEPSSLMAFGERMLQAWRAREQAAFDRRQLIKQTANAQKEATTATSFAAAAQTHESDPMDVTECDDGNTADVVEEPTAVWFVADGQPDPLLRHQYDMPL